MPGGVLPLLTRDGHGCRSTDTSGRSYIDYLMGFGTALLGFRHAGVDAAIRDQLEHGITPSLTSPLEIEVAEELCEMVPCAVEVAFGKNGSDVLAAAIRVARAYTRREKVLFCGYHGIHDWFMAADPSCWGVPQALSRLILPFTYNDLDSLRDLLEQHRGEVAAVIMEAAGELLPAPGFLEGVKRLTEEHEAVLIFDEVVTGLRLAPGGAQEVFGVQPHLACLAKTLGNGMPLSALVGPKDLGEIMARVGYGLTFRGESLSLAAAKATLRVCRDEPVAEHVGRIGDRIREGVDESARELGVPVRLLGPSPRMTFHIDGDERLSEHVLLTLFLQECLKRGVLHNCNLFPSYAHQEADVEQTNEVFRSALEVVGQARLRGSVDGLLHIPELVMWADVWSASRAAQAAREAEQPAGEPSC